MLYLNPLPETAVYSALTQLCPAHRFNWESVHVSQCDIFFLSGIFLYCSMSVTEWAALPIQPSSNIYWTGTIALSSAVEAHYRLRCPV